MSSGHIDLVEDAPEVNYNVRVVENKGLEVVTDETKGRVVRATRELGPGDDTTESCIQYTPLLRERPALVSPQEDYMAFMEQFLEAPLQVQLGILDMFYQPLDGPKGRSLLEPTQLLYFLGILEDATVIHQLLCILMTNGHQYRGDHVALVIFGSKFSHSCDPNAAYSSTAEDGCLEYLLLAKNGIQTGEEVTFSYLSDLFETPTMERRELLWETKSFFCQCPRCMGPDYCRCIKCDSCPSIVPCEYIQTDAVDNKGDTDIFARWEASWKCNNCDAVAETIEMQRKEREIERALQVVDREVTSRKNFDPSGGKIKPSGSGNDSSPAFLLELVQECIEELSSTHYLTIKALRLLIAVSTTQAYVIIKQNIVRGNTDALNLRVLSHLRMSVLSGIQLVLAGECVAAECTGCYLDASVGISSSAACFSIRHTPHYDRAAPMRHGVEEMLMLPIYMWPPNALEMAYRYLTTLRAKFKTMLQPKRHQTSAEKDIDLLDKVEICWDTLQCWDCDQLVWDSKVESVVGKKNSCGLKQTCELKSILEKQFAMTESI